MAQTGAQTGILALLSAFEQGRLDPAGCEQGLNQQIQLCTRRSEELARLRVPAEDQALWSQELRPGLEVCYEGLIGAASEALEYVKSRDESLLIGIHGLLGEVERIRAYVESRAGLASPETQKLLESGPAGDGLALESATGKGSAEAQVNFLDEG